MISYILGPTAPPGRPPTCAAEPLCGVRQRPAWPPARRGRRWWRDQRLESVDKAVADAVHGFDEAGSGGVVAEFLAQPLDVHVHRAGRAGVIVSPDVSQQFVPGEDPSRAAGQDV